MTIISTTTRIVERETPARLDTSYGDAPEMRGHVIVRLEDDSGHIGLGEASPLPHFTGETVSSIDLQLREQYLPMLVGTSPFDLNAIHALVGHDRHS